MAQNCFFCQIASGEVTTNLVYKDEKIVAFRDINPQAPTHILIIPKKHIPTINDLSDSDIDLMGRMFLVAKQLAAADSLSDDGYRIVLNCNSSAGQSVYHLHMHLIGGRKMAWPPG